MLTTICVFFAVVDIGLWWCSLAEKSFEPFQDSDSAPMPESTEMSSDFTARDLQTIVRIVYDNPNALGWRQSGTMKLPREEAVDAVRVLMAEKGYVPRNCVADARCALEMYGKDDACDVMWMIWGLGNAESGFSWGISK